MQGLGSSGSPPCRRGGSPRCPALDAERGGVDRDVGPALVDHEDHAERDPDLDRRPGRWGDGSTRSPRRSGRAGRQPPRGSGGHRLQPLRVEGQSRSTAAALRPKSGAELDIPAVRFARISGTRSRIARCRSAQPVVLGRAGGDRQLSSRRAWPGRRSPAVGARSVAWIHRRRLVPKGTRSAHADRSLPLEIVSLFGRILTRVSGQFETDNRLRPAHPVQPRWASQTLRASTVPADVVDPEDPGPEGGGGEGGDGRGDGAVADVAAGESCRGTPCARSRSGRTAADRGELAPGRGAGRGCGYSSCRNRSPGSIAIRSRSIPACSARSTRRARSARTSADDVVVGRVVLHRPGRALHVHQDHARTPVRRPGRPARGRRAPGCR